MKKILIIILIIFICGCSNKKIVISKEIDKVMDKDNYIILDVRTIPEYKKEHIENAINIPVETINENIDLDKSKDILVYCHSGRRSKMAYDLLKEMGYSVYDLGGIDSINLDKTSK